MHSPKNPLGDVLLCPVCFVEYEGRIMQCHQGHAVCEQCYLKLKECPHCRSLYVGTRNFVLEELITKLKGLTFKRTSVDDTTNSSEENGVKNTNEAPDNADRPVEIEIPLIPSPQESPNFANQLELTLAGLHELLDSVIVFPAPVQGKGSYICRMIGCSMSYPICRLLNHLRCAHKPLLEEVVVESREALRELGYTCNLSIPLQMYRKAYHIKSFGVFFLIVNVSKNSGATSIRGWIQCACPNSDARNFRFTLKITYGNTHAAYSDLVYGAQSDAAYIQQKEQCLTCSTRSTGRNMEIEIKVERNHGPTNTPRHSSTTVRILQVHQPTVTTTNNNGQNTESQTPSNRRRNRNRRR